MPTTTFSPLRYIICVLYRLQIHLFVLMLIRKRKILFIKIRNSYSSSGKIQLKNRRNSYSARNSYSGSGIPPFCVLSLPLNRTRCPISKQKLVVNDGSKKHLAFNKKFQHFRSFSACQVSTVRQVTRSELILDCLLFRFINIGLTPSITSILYPDSK